MDAGTENGFGYFHQPQHDLTAPLVNGGVFNAVTFVAHGWWLMPAYLARRRWRAYLAGLGALLLGVIVAKTAAERAIIALWMPDLADLPFHLLALENVFMFPAFVLFSAAYRFGRDWIAGTRLQPERASDAPGERIGAEPAADSAAAESIFVRSGGALHRVALAELLWVEGADKYLAFVLRGRRLLTVMTMREALAVLPERDFVRIHRSYIVALRHVESADRRGARLGGKRLPVSRTYRSALARQLAEHAGRARRPARDAEDRSRERSLPHSVFRPVPRSSK